MALKKRGVKLGHVGRHRIPLNRRERPPRELIYRGIKIVPSFAADDPWTIEIERAMRDAARQLVQD